MKNCTNASPLNKHEHMRLVARQDHGFVQRRESKESRSRFEAGQIRRSNAPGNLTPNELQRGRWKLRKGLLSGQPG